MKCNKCGEEIEADAKYCGKCGNKLKNKYDYKQFILNYKYLIIGIIVILIGIIFLTINKKDIYNNTNISDDKKTEEVQNENINKEYYDFIDTDYFTFDYTEDELLKIIFFGSTYSQEGYIKSVSTNDSNTTLYTRMAAESGFSGVETISITTDIRNYKVSKFKLSFVSNNNLTEEGANELLNAYLMQGISILLGNRYENMTSESEINKFNEIINDLGDKKDKGLSLAKTKNIRSVELLFSAKK